MHRALENAIGFMERVEGEGQEKGGEGVEKDGAEGKSLHKFMKVGCNEEQKKAVGEIIEAKGGRPIVIFGFFFLSFLVIHSLLTYFLFKKNSPPGTGKTTTLLEALYHILYQSNTNILLCASSNHAVDYICQQLSRNWPFSREIEKVFTFHDLFRVSLFLTHAFIY